MSWGEPSVQSPYDPNNPYGQQPYPQQPQQPQQPPQQQPPGWGAPSGPGYTQRMPDPSAYGQYPQQPQAPQQYPYDPSQGGGYGQQPGYGAPQGYPDYAGYVAPPPKKNNGALIATVLAAVLVVGGGITAAAMLTSKSNPSPAAAGQSGAPVLTPSGHGQASPSANSDSNTSDSTLSIPDDISGMKLLNNSDAKDAVKSMRSSLSSDKDLYPNPVIAAYNDGGGNNVTELFENQAISDLASSTQSEITSYDPSTIVSQLMTGAEINNAKTETTSADNGALSCGSRTVNSVKVVFCFWVDDTSFGGLEVFNRGSMSDAAAKADAIRAASEGN